MRRCPFIFAIGVAGASVISIGQGQVLTPEQLADPSTGQIPNESFQEYYIGQLSTGQSDTGYIIGAVSGTQASLTWYKYVSNGTSPVIFDMFGSNMSFGVGGFGASNYGELAVYDSQGNLVAATKDGAIPATGDSNIAATVPVGAPPAPVKTWQPLDPTKPVYSYSGDTWYADNTQSLPQIAFVNNPQSDPLWNPSNPNYDPYSNWNQYPILPAGTYFIAVAGYETYFSGLAGDASSIESYSPDYPISPGNYVTPTTPYGFIDFSAMSGTYEINVRLAGDFNGDGNINSTDVSLLRNDIAQYLPNGGIPTGVPGWDPSQGLNGLPDGIRQFDLTGNCRIDQNDLDAWNRYTGLSTALSITWNNSGAWGDGVTWDVTTSENFANSTGPDLYYDGDTVTFNDSNNGHYAVTLNAAVNPASVIVNNSAGNYTISGSGSIGGAGSLTKSGSGSLILSTVNNYAGGTTVTAGTLVAAVNGALPDGSLNITGGSAQLAANTGGAALTSLSIAPGGSLDIGNNHVILSDPGGGIDATIQGYLKNGYNSGNWNGAVGGVIMTSATTGTKYGIGYADGADGGIAGISSGQLEIKYTLYGDTNLDGAVNSVDFGNLAANFGKSGKIWDQGDFNYDGTVNSLDFGLLAGNFGKSVGSNADAASAADWAALDAFAAANGLIAEVPEPASFGLAALSAMSILMHRRRRRTPHIPCELDRTV
jgi:autotransporter-associated beta strand protein